MPDAEQCCCVYGDNSCVILQVLQVKAALKLFSRVQVTWHDDSMLCKKAAENAMRGLGLMSWHRQPVYAAVQAAAFAGLNGAGLALVLPCVQSILAEVYSAGRRGLAFGLVMTAGVLGEWFHNTILAFTLYRSCALAGRVCVGAL